VGEDKEERTKRKEGGGLFGLCEKEVLKCGFSNGRVGAADGRRV
jgi:hypothetical protein